MQNNWFFLKRLIPLLERRLIGKTLVSVFSQEKDELVMEFNDGNSSVFIRAVFSPQISLLLFPQTFRRARKNSADLFSSALMGSVESVVLYRNERSFRIVLGNGFQLLFKLHGPAGNVLLIGKEGVQSMFRNSLRQDLSIDPGSLDRQIDFSKDFFLSNYPVLHKSWFTFGHELWTWLEINGYGTIGAEDAWLLVNRMFRELEEGSFHTIRYQEKILFSLVPYGEILHHSDDPFLALERFHVLQTTNSRMSRLRTDLLNGAQAQLRMTSTLVARYEARLAGLSGDSCWQEWADLIMANMHQIVPGSEVFEVESMISPGKTLTIRLDPSLTPQRNAEEYYRKSRSRKSEQARLEEALITKRRLLQDQSALLGKINQAASMEELESLSGSVVRGKEASEDEERLPYLEFECMGYRILVGKSARDNDELTLRYAGKNDLWLHARDCPGSHVVVRNRPGTGFPKPVLERAAALAAWYSKRRGESLCPVSYTEKKYVRKRKGDPPGAVVMDRETVIMVEPSA